MKRRGSVFILCASVILLFVILFRVSAASSSVNNTDAASLVNSAECFSEYKCEDWGECIEGLRSRTCEDTKCDRRAIIERKFCDELTCKPQVKCTSWSDCVYTDKTEDIFGGKIRFGGYRSRVCRDATGCIDSFTEEGSCEEFYDLELREVKECGISYMAAIDPLSRKEIAKINLDSWKNKRLDLAFTSGNTAYCPTCYNGVKDVNETDIDCGGDCRPCKAEQNLPLGLLIYGFWFLSSVFSILILREVIISRRRLGEFPDKSKIRGKKL